MLSLFKIYKVTSWHYFIPLILFFGISLSSATAQSESVEVFISGEDGYANYRIPAIIHAPNGDLLAFCEGRTYNAADFGDIDIVMKRSVDGGQSWSILQKIVDNGHLQAGNSAPAVDMMDPKYPQGRIFLFYNTGNNTEHEVRKGNGYREVWYITSEDFGHSWSRPVNITSQVHKMNKPELNPNYLHQEDWRAYANTPGHAMQITTGDYKGRIYVAANHSTGEPLSGFADYQAHGYYTDDHGKTFHLSEDISVPGSNESTAAEISGGKIIFNSRNQTGDIRARIISTSGDGGMTWDTTYFDSQLADPVNQGSLLTLSVKKNKSIIAFCNAADGWYRDNLTLRISYDDGKTWKKSIVVDKSETGMQDDFTAYSDLVRINKKEIGVLYERNGYREIVFRKIKWK